MNRKHCSLAFLRKCIAVPSLMLSLCFASATSATILVDMNFNGPTGLENPGLGPDGVLKDGATIVSGELRTNGSNAAAGSGLDLPLGKQLAYAFSGGADFHLSFDFATLSNGQGTLFNADGAKYLYDTIPGFNPDLTDPPGGGQRGSLAIYCQATGIKVDLWFLGVMQVGGTFNDNQLHNVSLDYSAHDAVLTLMVDHSDDLVSQMNVNDIVEGGFFRDTSHDLIRVGDINNPDSELGEQGVVIPIAARFDNLLLDGSPEPPVKLIVNRATGAMSIQGLSSTPVPINSISILSEAGGRTVADIRVGAGAESLGQLVANVELDVGVAHGERLRIGVAGDEFDAAQSSVDHAVDGIGTAAADADDLDDCQITSAVHEIPSDPLVRVEGFAHEGCVTSLSR